MYPTEIQEQKLWQSVGTARFVYNWTLARQEENYKNGEKFIKDGDLRKEITQLKKNELSWLKEVSNNVTKHKQLKTLVINIKDFSKVYQINRGSKVEKRINNHFIMTIVS